MPAVTARARGNHLALTPAREDPAQPQLPSPDTRQDDPAPPEPSEPDARRDEE
jgi:hypothetical protein